MSYAPPRSACTEVWVRSPYEDYIGTQELPSTVSLPPASLRSLPTSNCVVQGSRKPLQHHIPPGSEQEQGFSWYPSSVMQKMVDTFSSPGSSRPSAKCDVEEPAQAVHHVHPSVDPSRIAADDFAHATRTSNAAGVSFLFPSALCAADCSKWQDSEESATRPHNAMASRQEPMQGVGPLDCGLGMLGHADYDTDTDDGYDRAWNAVPKRELTENALRHLQASLQHALANASAMERTVPPTACNASGHRNSDRQARPSMPFP